MGVITKSASKIVFILMALGVTLMTASGIVEAKDYIILVSMAFSYYFTQKSSNSDTTIPQ